MAWKRSPQTGERIRRRSRFGSALSVLLGASVVFGTLVVAPAAQAQFAEGGEGRHRASIDWFTFDEASQRISEGQVYSNERQIGDDKIVSTCAISGIDGEISTYRSGDFAGDGLSRLYYKGGPGTANTMITGITNTQYGGEADFLFDCSASYVTADGTTTPIPLQGLVVADAESSSKSTDEWMQVDPRPLGADVTWRIIDRSRNADCPVEDTTLATATEEGGIRFDPARYECIGWSSEGFGPMAVGFMEGATSAHVTMNGGGHSAVALGMVMSVDFGDAPESYGAAGAIFQPQWTGTEIRTGDAPRDVFAGDFELGSPGESPLTLGSHIDAETNHQYSWDALLDDESGRDPSLPSGGGDWAGSDEDAIPLIALPTVTSGALFNDGAPLAVECRGEGVVAGWLDWNLDGTFDPETERSEIAACTGNQAVLTWPDLAEFNLPAGTDPTVYLRLRIAANEDGLNPTGVLVPTGVGSAGEVEDYALGVPLIEAFKESDPLSGSAVLAGDEITYTLTFHNLGNVEGAIVYDDFLAEVLNKADFVPGSVSIESLDGPSPHGITVSEPTGDPLRLVIDGTMQPGQIVNISYRVKVTSETPGDFLENYLLHVDDSGTPLEEFDECIESNPRCTTHEVLATDLQVRKSTLPGDGQVVRPGQLVTYRLDFDNEGNADADVNYVDDLTEVLKYADVLPDSIHIIGAHVPGSDPEAPEEFSIDADYDEVNQQILVTGKIYAGNSGRVEYVVRVHDPITPPEGGGAPALTNFLYEAGTTPPTTCEPGDELCTTHPVELPDLKVQKSADPAAGESVVAGEDVTYTLTFDNTTGKAPATVAFTDDLTDVLDDAAVKTEPAASAAGLVPTRDGNLLEVAGKVPAGEQITVSYVVTVKDDGERGNEQLTNFMFEEGTDPPTTCEPGDDLCTTHPVDEPDLQVSKSSDPASGDPVVAGDTVNYTLTFDNTAGTAPATVNHVDELTDVLDDAEIATEPTASAAELTPVRDGATLAVTGAVPAGESITVSYSVTVKHDGDRGNEQLANFLFEEGAEPPTTCEPDDDTCTTHPVQKPELKVSKSADPAPGEAVVAADEVTYTLTFDNTTGTAPAVVNYVDDLSDVLDDAELASGPTVNPAGALTGAIDEATGEFPVAGTLAAGATATVSYTVKVKADGDRGNEQLANFLFAEGTEPPTTCEPGDDTCTTHPVEQPNLKVSKGAVSESGNDFVTAGEMLTYTLTFDNSAATAPATVQHVDHLAGVLDDADLTDGPTSSDPDALAAALSDDGTQIGVTGAVPAGAVVTVTYVVTVKVDGERGDNSLANFLTEEGVDPPTTCEPGDNTCTVTPAPELTYTKAAVSESGNDFVTAGEKLTYTLTFDNSKGTAPAALNHVDDLAKVLDDADVTDGPASSDPANVTATLDSGAEHISATGSVPAGQVVRVTYVVTVKADGERGDNTLANFLLEEGAEPPVTCLPGDETCTETHVPELVLVKSSDPVSGEPVIAGQEITYTLTFDNSTGKAPAAVNHVDELSDVLDDAKLVEGPTVAPAGALVGEITDGVFAITGELAAGAKATVSYTVKVKADGDRGNEQLANFLFEEGAEPPTTCEPGDDTCTTHPAQSADVSVKKSVDPASGTEVVAGQAVTYTLAFTNAGEAPGDVDYTDDLSDVLDDAGITVEPTASAASLTPNRTGDELRITGRLAAGATVTVTYEVTVNADGERGNDHLGNVVVETGEEPVCDPDAENCTENPVVFPIIDAQKGSDPESGTVLHAGDDVTYTLTFTNTGTGAGELAFRDRLEEVLDTADIVSGPTVAQGEGSSATAVVNGEGIDIAGTIAPGGTVTVTYSVRLHSEVDHGDRLTNYLLAPGESVPGLCLPENPRCTDHPAVAPELDVDKSSDPASGEAVEAGQVVTYTLWFHNWSPAEKRVDYVDTLTDVLDDATFVEGSLKVDSTALKAIRSGDKIRITGTLGPDTETTVTYQVTVKPDAERVPEGEAPAGTTPNQLGNVVIESGQEPPAVCEPGDWHCTVNPMPNVIAKKSSDPASGEAVVEGQELTYTLHFENVGTAAGQVAFRDTLRDVLDDADFVDGSLVASEGLQASGPTANEILVTGSLAAGATGTVEYSVTVKPDTERESAGNNQLANFVFGEGTEPPTTCEPGDDTCTTHPAPDLVVSKGVDPESGTTVAAGQKLTYTLTFSNAGNAAGEVAYEDHLAGVLDDATLVSGPESDSALLSATLDGDRILIAGELHPGETVRVTYTVRVLGDAERGDSVLGNFVVKPGVTPPAVCEPGSTLCTENPVPPTPVKPVPPLEETGGASTLPWLLGGGAVILLGAALLLVRRKRGGDSAESPAGSAESTDGN